MHRRSAVPCTTCLRRPTGARAGLPLARFAVAGSRKAGYIEKSALRRVWGFELECPLLQSFSLDRRRAGPSLEVTKLKTPPKLLDRRIQVMQFHRHTKTSRT